MKRIQELIDLGYSVEFIPSVKGTHFVTLKPLFGYNTKVEDDTDFEANTIAEALDIALKAATYN